MVDKQKLKLQKNIYKLIQKQAKRKKKQQDDLETKTIDAVIGKQEMRNSNKSVRKTRTFMFGFPSSRGVFVARTTTVFL